MAKTHPHADPTPDDPLASAVQGYAGGDPAKAAAVMGTMMELLQQKGALGGLLDALRQGGLGADAAIVDAIAAKLGLTPDQARSLLAQLVPELGRAANQDGPESR
jgi:uncharacterized protein YidB (DUF937 family)